MALSNGRDDSAIGYNPQRFDEDKGHTTAVKVSTPPSLPQIGSLRDVRLGSKTEVSGLARHVGFTPMSRHRQPAPACPFGATRRLMHRNMVALAEMRAYSPRRH